jgi:alkanesulfonate monooxygenase SsuD/methylene tetrahydromethanopterin reductase-like flavin-dependent oxidoreductase (luciferase family)
MTLGFTPAALRRAVRFGDGFTVLGANRDVYDRYVAELEKVNRPTDNLRFASGFWFLIVSDDPERTFAEAQQSYVYAVAPDVILRRGACGRCDREDRGLARSSGTNCADRAHAGGVARRLVG